MRVWHVPFLACLWATTCLIVHDGMAQVGLGNLSLFSLFNKYFLIAPELSKIQQQFEETYLHASRGKRTKHHKMTGEKLSQVGENDVKLCHVFQEHGDPFHSAGEHELINMLTQSVMSEAVTNDILQRDIIGQQMFVDFVNQCLIDGTLSVWGKMTKRNLKTFKSESATTEIKIGNQLIMIKEEQNLLNASLLFQEVAQNLI